MLRLRQQSLSASTPSMQKYKAIPRGRASQAGLYISHGTARVQALRVATSAPCASNLTGQGCAPAAVLLLLPVALLQRSAQRAHIQRGPPRVHGLLQHFWAPQQRIEVEPLHRSRRMSSVHSDPPQDCTHGMKGTRDVSP